MVVSSKPEMLPDWMKMDTMSFWDVSMFNYSKPSSLRVFYDDFEFAFTFKIATQEAPLFSLGPHFVFH